MKVNQEIEAFQTFGISPFEFLVVPRMVALILMMPLLCIFADLIAIIGGFLVSTLMLDVSPLLNLDRTVESIRLSTFLIGVFKGGFFGVIVALTGCLRGMQCGTNAAAVGMATTFFHLIPQAAGETGLSVTASSMIVVGILSSFAIERFLQWRHCHIPTSQEHPHSFAYMNLFGDAVHNLLDGLIMGASYLASVPLGVATTIAVLFHEIPQELGDFSVLVYGGFSKRKALTFNLLTALTAVAGAMVAFALGSSVEGFVPLLIPFAAGNFIYIAGSDLIPELRKDD